VTFDDAAEGNGSNRSRAVSVLRAEFIDRGLEKEFAAHHLTATAQRVRTTGLLAAFTCLTFTVADLSSLGFSTAYFGLLAFRAAIVIAAVVFTSAIRRRPTLAVSWPLVTLQEASTFLLTVVVMAVRPGEPQLHTLGIAVTIMATFLLIPNRYSAVLVLNTVGVAVFAVAGAVLIHDAAEAQVAANVTVVSFLIVGAIAANQLQRARREEFLALLHERTANAKLVGEISRRRVLEDELTWMATHDPLTDLLNRRAFYEQAEREAARSRRSSQPLSILVLDADEFKAVNDRYGHHAGDEALRRISDTCQRYLRTEDVIGRIGGEEFAALMPGLGSDAAQDVAERLRQAIAQEPLRHALGAIEISVSIGVTEYRPWEEAVIDGIARADEAMYLAKLSGRNCVVPA
jgi:diguanylate cyclase (GGDEF)-like protein